MAYIQPTSNIYILKDVPLNPSYDDTFTFKTKEEQFNYFSNFSKFQLDNYSVVRERLNTLKVEGDIGRYYDVNYMIFQNENFSDKWFYAFIVRVEYLNPNTTLITFTLDVMQSWMFDYTILPSLVEREHVEDDSLYANIENEGINVNERIAFDNPINFEPYIGRKILVIGSTENPTSVEIQADSPYNIEYNPYDLPPRRLQPWYAKREWIITDISNPEITYTLNGKTGYFKIISTDINTFTFIVKTFVEGQESTSWRVTAIKSFDRTESNHWSYSSQIYKGGDSNG